MTSQPVEANVVLTADNSQYDQAMIQSAGSTNQLGKSIDGLGEKIGKLTKSAGKKLLGITAADVALITGATAAWASYEKQMARLNAQAAITGRGREAEQKTMRSYTETVKNLRKEFGSTTSEAAQLTQTIAKMADQTRSLKELGTVFTEMSHATGESSSGLASSLLNLQKVMGTPQSATRAYADQLTTLAAKSNTSASALADFSAQIAPMGRAMGMSQKQVIGFANMFTKAGQDGVASATAFSKVSQDITQAVQTGSPELKKYANLLGVTTKQFTQMDSAAQVGGFFDQIAKMGPRASQELNRFGLDGIRMSKAITATVQASGGAMNALREADAAYGSGSTKEGSQAAMTMTDQLQKLRQELQMTAEEFGKAFGPGIMIVLKGVTAVAGKLEDLMDGPLGKFIQMASAVIIPITALAGGFLLVAGAVTKVAAAFALLKSSPALGLMEGLKGGARIAPEVIAGQRTGMFVGAGGEAGRLGERGAQIAERGSSFQRYGYNVAQRGGAGIRGGFQFLGRLGADVNEEGVAQRPNIFQRGTVGGIRMGGTMFRQGFDQLLYPNPADRHLQLRQHFLGIGAPKVEAAVARTTQAEKDLLGAKAVQASLVGSQAMGGGATNEAIEAKKKDIDALEKHAKAMKLAEERTVQAEKVTREAMLAQRAETAARKGETTIAAAASKELALLTGTIVKADVAVAKFGVSTAMATARRAGGALIEGLGGPVSAGLMGVMMLPMLIPMLKDMFGKEEHKYEYKKLGASGQPYLEAAGVTLPGAPDVGIGSEKARPTLKSARAINESKIAQATATAHKLSDKNLYNLNEKEVTAYLSTNFSRFKNNPEALDMLSQDLIDKFDPDTAERILRNLETGKGEGGPEIFLRGAREAEGSRRDKLLNMATQVGTDQERRAYGRGGTPALFRRKGRNIAGLFGEAVSRGDEDVLEDLNKTYGLSIDSSVLTKIKPEAQIRAAAGLSEGQAIPKQFGMTQEQYAKMDTREQLKYLTTRGSAEEDRKLKGKLGIDEDATGKALDRAIADLMTKKGAPPEYQDEAARKKIADLGGAAEVFAQDPKVQEAVKHFGQNVGENIKGVDSMMQKAREAGKTSTDLISDMGKIKSVIGDDTDPNYILANWVSGEAQQQLSMAMPTMTRGQAFGAQVDLFQAQTSFRPTTDQDREAQQQAKQQMAGALSDQVNYFRQLLIMQDNYDKQRQRAQEDYTLQRRYAEFDYQLQRSRAEDAFERQRKRAVEDFNRNRHRAYFNFHLQRKRAEEDFNHSVSMMAKQQAQSIYDIYNRVQVQRTTSAEWLLSNAADQLKRMQEQAANLDKVRKMGLNDSAIQQLKLTDPNNAQQLARFVTELTPDLIAQFNKTAGTAREKAAKAIVTDPSSLEWKEMRRGFKLNMERGAEDFERQMRESRQDFRRGLRIQRDEFKISLDQQQEDYQRGMNRQEAAYHKMQKHAAQDLADTAKELNMTLEEVLTEGGRRLTGAAQKQVKAVTKAFTDLKTNTSPEAIALMQELAEIFGFEYKIPKGVSNNKPKANQLGANNPAKPHAPRPGQDYAQGGVLPGYTPGKDVHHFHSPTAGDLHLSGGEGIMVPEWVKAIGGPKGVRALNKAARDGKYASGGVFWPVPGHRVSTYAGHDGADINRGSGSDDLGDPIRAFRSGRITYVGYGHGYGQAIFQHTGAGNVVYGHTSKVHVHAGQNVRAGQLIGNVGSTGNSSAPHLHFGIPGGTYSQALALLSGGRVGGFAGFVGAAAGGGAPVNPMDILKERYHRAEVAARDMDGVHPLFQGDISYVINKYARKKIHALVKKFGNPVSAGGMSGVDIGSEPSGNLTNERIVHTGAVRMGWGNQWPALRQLVMHESGFRNTAQNPSSTAYGMFQFLDSTWRGVGGHKTSDPWKQTQYGLRYIKNSGNFHDPNSAWNFWQKHHWYGDGAVFDKAQTIGVGEKGPEAVIPLNERGANFMSDVMGSVMGGRNVTPMRSGVNVYNTRVDRSTNFNGPITVQANNPQELIQKLQARQRVMALSRPSLTGSAA